MTPKRMTLAAVLAVPVLSFAQTASPPPSPDPRDERDMALNLVEPDFTTVNLPTTLRLPRMKGAFRVTHRFARSLSDGSFGDLASDLFGIDRGALIARTRACALSPATARRLSFI